jgi:thymidine phosphorylase
MSQPLGEAVGNALEVRESVEVLLGRGPADVRELTLDLAAVMLHRAGAEAGVAAARARAARTLESGAAWLTFLAMVEAQGGDRASVERAEQLPRAPVQAPVPATRSGRITAIDAYGLGELVVSIGGGRRAKEDPVDPRVGLLARKRLGDPVRAGEPLAELHLASQDPAAVARAGACFTIGDEAVVMPPLILERVE